ncbi:TIGR02444 family protein [Pseudomonas sp. v388]|uniref:TIGR02444 family protein n=1 Tax=Pseudomonas sp. v388 TaxID=2479849 RepID=UPI000F7A4DB5|nr:TIGR02444 family protein [Pseudomonas sp. v388]RRV09096.1 TIGR02444 family protein [Pseudomonas sp. v388]
MPSDLWSFTLDFYARPGVEQACLDLQAGGANVCMVLCGVWLAMHDVPCNGRRLREVRERAEPWHADVVRPLRELRSRWKAAAIHDSALSALREQVKALELDAERQLLTSLQALVEAWPAVDERGSQEWLSEVAGEAGKNRRGALQVLRDAAGLTTNQT